MKELLTRYASGGYIEYNEYANQLVGGESRFDIELTDQEKEETKEMLQLIQNQKAENVTLYRIERNFRENLNVGDTLNFGIISTTRDLELLDRALSGAEVGLDYSNIMDESGQVTLFKINGNHNHLDIDEYSSYNQAESLLTGKYKVTSIENTGGKVDIGKEYTITELADKFPEKYERFTSKKGKEMIRFKENGKAILENHYSTFTVNGEDYFSANKEANSGKKALEKKVITLEKAD